MAKKFDRRAVRTYHFDEIKWAVVRYFDGQLSGVLKGTEVEDEETGLTLQEGYLQEGDHCMAKWLDKKMYKAKILFLGSDKEEAAKQATLLKVAYPDKKQEKKADAESEPKKRKLANPDKATEPTKKEPKTTKAAEKKAQIRAQEKMVEELLAVQYGHGDSDEVEELKRSLEEKDNVIKEKEEIIKEKELLLKEKEQLLKDKDEELFAMKANLARLEQPKTIPCPCNGAMASSLRSEGVQNFISQLAELCPVIEAAETLPQPTKSLYIPRPSAFSPPPKSRLMSPPAPPPPSPSLSPVSPQATTPSSLSCGADLVDLGGGVMVKKIVLDACLSSAKGSTSKLVRNLLHAFFSDQELGESSAEGKGTKAALPTMIVAAIKGNSMKDLAKFSPKKCKTIWKYRIEHLYNNYNQLIKEPEDNRERVGSNHQLPVCGLTEKEQEPCDHY